ncbi:MAG: hypothetical protein HYV97_08265 [Bdellovibrio sp.]|nr:hypothetical protein [Bdellovibrio sp.]
MRAFVQPTLLLFLLSWGATAFAQFSIQGLKFEDQRELNGVKVQNAKIDDARVFHATLGKVIERPFADVVSDILHFEQRCNNEYRDKRRFSPKEFNCQHLNKNLVESVIIREIKLPATKMENEKERFLIFRNIYNREAFQNYDLVIYTEKTGGLGKRVAMITYSMLSDEEAQQYLTTWEKKKSVFDIIQGSYEIEELEGGKCRVGMTYTTKTSYWMMTNGFAVGMIYKSMAEGTMSTLLSFEHPLAPVPVVGSKK